ncbi:MAG: hypothetical protein J6M31_05545, partial [Bacteroidales bacterium]|nr:hypothetical protein [Bacteroidales bacterium]
FPSSPFLTPPPYYYKVRKKTRPQIAHYSGLWPYLSPCLTKSKCQTWEDSKNLLNCNNFLPKLKIVEQIPISQPFMQS